MTLKFTQSELARVFAVLSPYLGKSISIRILKGGMLEMFAAPVQEGGSVLARIPCNKTEKPTPWMHVDSTVLQGLVQIADQGELGLTVGESGLTLKSPGSTSEIRFANSLLSPGDMKFGKTSATIQGKDFNLLSTMTEAASTEEARANLYGIHIEAGDKKLSAAAADGYILSFTAFQSEVEAPGALYSVKALGRARRAIKAADDEKVAIGFHVNGIALSVQRNQTDFLFDIPKMQAGPFPDYMAIVNGVQKAATVKVETTALVSFLKRANAIDGNIFLQALNGFLWLMAKNDTTKEQCLDSISIDVKDESEVMHYAHGLLKDALKACAANGHVILTFPKSNKSPMLFEGDAAVIAMPLMNPLKESPFKGKQPALI